MRKGQNDDEEDLDDDVKRKLVMLKMLAEFSDSISAELYLKAREHLIFTQVMYHTIQLTDNKFVFIGNMVKKVIEES